MTPTHQDARSRFAQLIAARLPEERRFRILEKESGISFDSWRKAYSGGQRPTIEMLETVARLWPEHAFWLATGLTDNKNGHHAPNRESTLDTAFKSLPAAVEFHRMRAEFLRLSLAESRSLKERWDDWLTEVQEKNTTRYRWAVVHPLLAERKEAKQRKARAVDERLRQLTQLIDEALRKRDAEAKAAYGLEED